MMNFESANLGVYSIKDKHVGMYLPPFLASSDDEAKRIVSDSIEPNSVLARFPADYQLVRCGVFNSKIGLSRNPEDNVPDVLCSITDIIRDQILDQTSPNDGKVVDDE